MSPLDSRPPEGGGRMRCIMTREGAEEANRVIVGSYTGNGTGTRTITLGVHPKMVLLFCAEYSIGDPYSDAYGGMASRDWPAKTQNWRREIVAVTNNGFVVHTSTSSSTEDPYSDVNANKNGLHYNYIAIY